jgi:hypothetical protein
MKNLTNQVDLNTTEENNDKNEYTNFGKRHLCLIIFKTYSIKVSDTCKYIIKTSEISLPSKIAGVICELPAYFIILFAQTVKDVINEKINKSEKLK